MSTALGDKTTTTTSASTSNNNNNNDNRNRINENDDENIQKKNKEKVNKRALPSNHSFELLSDAIPPTTTTDFDSPNPNGTPFYQTDAPLDPEGEKYVAQT